MKKWADHDHVGEATATRNANVDEIFFKTITDFEFLCVKI